MASSLTNISNITDGGTLELVGASYVTTAVVGGVTYVFVASRVDDGVSVFSLGANGALTPVFDFPDNAQTSLGGAFALTSVVVGGTTYLYTAAITEYGLTGFSVDADGALTVVANVPDNATLQLALTTDVKTVVVGGTTYLFSGGANDGGVSVFSVGADGALTNVDNVIDDATSKIAGPQGMTTAVVGGTTYLFVTGYHDDGVGVFSVAANGDLINVFNVQDAGLLELDGPVDVITAVVGGTTYLFVTAFDDDGISVFSVAANGALTNVFNQPDDGLLELDNAVGMSIAVLGGTTYLFAVGADDDGLSVFKVAANGALTNVANVTDVGDFELDRPIGVTTVVMNGRSTSSWRAISTTA